MRKHVLPARRILVNRLWPPLAFRECEHGGLWPVPIGRISRHQGGYLDIKESGERQIESGERQIACAGGG